jgi:polysaccharide export outer membrane protein
MINFPILGTLYVKGMTVTELQEYIAGRLTGTYLQKKPVVTVEMANFRVTVIGEVAKSGVYSVDKGKINIFEALALAGDMTIYGRRDNVKVIREDGSGNKSVHELDLTRAETVTSPFYQLQQNDIVYVTPNKAKTKNSDIGSSTSLWFTSVSIVISLASLLYNILK